MRRAVVDRLREVARTNDRTLSGQVRRVLREWADGEQPTVVKPADR